MDVLFMHTSVYEIPASRRAGAIVYDGSADMRLFRGPGSDRELDRQWGGGLQRALDTELDKLGGGPLPLGSVARAVRGRLHCDFLLWAVTSGPRSRLETPAAPPPEAVHEAVLSALEFVDQRSIARVAFPALGHGEGAAEPAVRYETIVRAAHAYVARLAAEGRGTGIEEVFLCEPSAAVIRAAERRVPDLVERSALASSPSFGGGSGGGGKSPFGARGGARRGAATGARSTGSSGASSSRARAKKPAAPTYTISADEIAAGRQSGAPYETRRRYSVGDVITHSKFGVGRVVEVTDARAVLVVFEDQAVRKMAHARG